MLNVKEKTSELHEPKLNEFKQDLRMFTQKRTTLAPALPNPPSKKRPGAVGSRVRDTRPKIVRLFPELQVRDPENLEPNFDITSDPFSGETTENSVFDAGWWLLPSMFFGFLIWLWLFSWMWGFF